MRWLFQFARRLREQGILGMNGRNASYILDCNPRECYPLADDKLRLHDLCARIGAPTPEVYGVVDYHSMLRRLERRLGGRDDFVVKPNHGSCGRGILVVVGREGKYYLRHNGERWRREQVRQHLSDILSGMYSLGGRPDQAILQQRVRLHPAFAPVAYRGIPDVRIIVYRNEPAMAMLRLPTKASNGRANLHQGGIGAGVDLASGLTHHAVQGNRFVLSHPDTDIPVIGMRVPYWRQVLDLSSRVAQAVGLGYLGVDIVIDAEQGPLLLEANARPGLSIQLANARGLLPQLAEIEARIRGQESEIRSQESGMGSQERLRRSA